MHSSNNYSWNISLPFSASSNYLSMNFLQNWSYFITNFSYQSNDNGKYKNAKQCTAAELDNCWEQDHVTTCTIDDDEEPKKCESIIVLKDVQVEFEMIGNFMKLFTLQLFSHPASRMCIKLLSLLMFLVAYYNFLHSH